MILLATLAGVGLIVIALRDIFETLFHPSGKGVVSRMLAHGAWQAFRRLAVRYPAALQLAGPAGFLAVIASWVALLGRIIGSGLGVRLLAAPAGRVLVRSRTGPAKPGRVRRRRLPLGSEPLDAGLRRHYAGHRVAQGIRSHRGLNGLWTSDRRHYVAALHLSGALPPQIACRRDSARGQDGVGDWNPYSAT